MCLIKEERCSSDGLLIFYGPMNVVELGKELRNSVILHCFLWEALRVVSHLLSASKTYIESVLFRTSAYTGAKLASRVPLWFRDLPRQNLVPGHLVPFPGHLIPLFGSPRPIFYNGF